MASIIDPRSFSRLRKELSEFDAKRERLIRLSRDVISCSKQVIAAVHRKDMKGAATASKPMVAAVLKMKSMADGRLQCQGSYKVAMQEYVEAKCLLSYAKDKKLLTAQQLKVGWEHYLLGISDLVGELLRRAVNQGIEGHDDEVFETHSFVTGLYNELLQFDFMGGEVRKKFDSIKWDLKRLDEMVFALKLKSNGHEKGA